MAVRYGEVVLQAKLKDAGRWRLELQQNIIRKVKETGKSGG